MVQWHAWADEVLAINAALVAQRNALLVALGVCLILGAMFAWRWRPGQQEGWHLRRCDDTAPYITYINLLLARGAPLVEDLRRGVAVFDDVVLVSTAMTIRIEAHEKVSDERLRSMILEDVERNNGVALRIVKTGDPAATSLRQMDRSDVNRWLSSLKAPSI